MTKFLNPYFVVDLRTQGERVHRTTIRLPARVAGFLEHVHGPGGQPTLQVTINLFLKAVYERLNKSGITDYDPAAYESLVCGLVDAINTAPIDDSRRGPATQTGPGDEPRGETPQGNDRRGATAMAQPSPSSDIQPSDAAKRGTRRSKGQGNKVVSPS